MEKRQDRGRRNEARYGAGRWAGQRCGALAMMLALAPASASCQGLALADALRLALANNPAIAIHGAQLESAAGRAQQVAGLFDSRVFSRIDYEKIVTPLSAGALARADPGQAGETRLFATGYQVGIDKQLRNGLLVSSALTASRRDEAPNTHAALGVSKLDVTLTVPLLQGRAGADLRGTEEAARLAVQARRYDLLDRTARTLHDTLIAYWVYRTRAELEGVAASSEERSAGLLRSIEKLVEASEKPRADLVLLQADLAEKRGMREATRLALADARTSLGRILGLEPVAIGALGPARDELPVAGPASTGQLAPPARLAQQALERRPDVQSLALQLAALQRQLDVAGEALKPRLDLSLGLAHTKVGEGGGRYRFIGEAGRTASAPSLFAHLNLQLPLENNSAGGAVRERAAIVSEMAIRQRDLQHGVASGVDSALTALASSVVQLEAARRALAMYEQAVAQEIIKQKNGISTLIDVINTEARFVSARTNLLQARLAHASALARLRLETGTLLPIATGERFTLDLAGLAGLGPLSDGATISP